MLHMFLRKAGLKIWIWRPHHMITLGVKDSGWKLWTCHNITLNVSCKIAKLDISMSSQKFFKPCARLYNYYAITTTVIFILHIAQARKYGNTTHTLQFYNNKYNGHVHNLHNVNICCSILQKTENHNDGCLLSYNMHYLTRSMASKCLVPFLNRQGDTF